MNDVQQLLQFSDINISILKMHHNIELYGNEIVDLFV